MSTFLQNKWSSVGLFLGAIALILSIFQFSLGPFSPRLTIENRVEKQVAAIKKGIIAGIRGEKAQTTSGGKEMNIDSLIINTSISLAIGALLLAFVGGMCKENRWGVNGALFFGGGTLAFHAILFGMAVVFILLILSIFLALLTGLLS